MSITQSTPNLPIQFAVDILIDGQTNHAPPSQKLPQSRDTTFSGVKIDSRKIQSGDIFLALEGEQVDGHLYIQEAIDRGAVAIVTKPHFDERTLAGIVPIIKVPCTQKAFGQLAYLWRSQLFKGQVIALTGSNGKTTIKNMLTGILQTQYKTGCTQGNYNNELGLPITIFELDLNCDYWILEMGARHIGDIDYLCHIAMPDITFISNIGNAHIGVFGGREKQLQAKSEILKYGNVVMIDTDSPFAQQFTQLCQQHNKEKILTIAKKQNTTQSSPATVTWDFNNNYSEFHIHNERLGLKLNCLGEHNAHNAAWAVAVANYCAIKLRNIISGLKTVYPTQGRLQSIQIDNFIIIDDSYNASPESLEALLKLKQPSTDKVIMVWGDMAELGDEKCMHQWHRQAAELFNQYCIDWVITYGKYAYSTYLHGQTMSTQTKYTHAKKGFTEIKQMIEEIIQKWQQEESSKTQKSTMYIYLKAANKMQFSQLATLLTI